MRLLRLEVHDLKRFTGTPRVVVFDGRATVLHGANEAGKSTLFEAVRHALFDRSRTQARWVERLVPYGSRAIPTVQLDFEHTGRTLRIEKRFGAKGEATLSEKRPDGAWTTLARNEEGEEMLLAILGATASGARDGSPPANWGAFQWLLVPQDLRALPEADAADHLGLDAAGVSDAFDAVRRRVQGEFEQTFTPKGKIAAQSDLAVLEKRLGDLDLQRVTLEQEVARLAELRRLHDEKLEELPRTLADVTLAKAEWEEAQSEAEGLSSAQGEHQAATEALRGAKDRAGAAATVLAERLRLEQAARDASAAHTVAVSDEAQARALFEQTTRLWNEARTTAAQHGDEAAALRRKALDAERCLGGRSARREVETLREVHRRAVEADEKVEAARARTGGEPPAPSTVSRAQEVDNEARAKKASARVASLCVTIEGKPAAQILADGVDVAGGDAVALDSVVVVAGSGRVTVRGDTAQAQRLVDEASDLERKLGELLAPFAVTSVEELRALREERLARKAELGSAEKEREAIDARATADLAAEITSRSAQADEDERARREAGADPSHDALSDEALRDEVRRIGMKATEAEKAFEAVRKEREKRNNEYESRRTAQDLAAQQTARAEATSIEAASALDRHRDAQGSTDRCREADGAATKDLRQAVARESQARTTLERISGSAEIRRQSARQKYVRLDEAARAMEAQISHLAETLDRDSVRGAYSSLGEIERTLESERARYERLRLAAEALRTLRDVVDGVRGEVVQRVVAPIKDDLDELLAVATSGRYTLAGLDDRLRPERLTGAAGISCEFDGGSQGLRELVATLVRVAVARHLAKTEPQTVILDDPCVHVSRERTSRLVDILNALASSGGVQVVVLTHRQGEFAGLMGSTVDVTSLS